MAERVIVIGASAGGVETLRTLVKGLSPQIAAPILIVVHLNPLGKSYLAEILGNAGRLPAVQAEDGMALRNGHIYVAPPDRHLLAQRDHVHLSRGPRENRARPSINTLFRSAAAAFGADAIGVVLSGSLDDGTVGLWEIKRAGGVAVVQNPEEAPFPEMPQNAVAHVAVDYIVRLADMAELLKNLAAAGTTVRGDRAGDRLKEEGAKSEAENSVEALHMRPQRTDFTCPECKGALREKRYGTILQFECRTGHTYSADTMLTAHAETEENALWAAVVALEEGAELYNQLADSTVEDRENLAHRAEEKRAQARAIRGMIARK